MKIIWNPALAQPGEKFISLSKPAKVLQRVFDTAHDELIECAPAWPDQLAQAHAPSYIRRVLQREVPDGFHDQTGENLEHILAANGAMIAAAKEALATPGNPVFAPVSGFHHAHYRNCYGYCTFNGLMVAAAAVLQSGLMRYPNVLIIDGDGHEGDGTEDIIKHLPEFFGDGAVTHVTRMNAESWRRRISEAMSAPRIGLVLYQAGADAHIDDPYGVGYLSDEAWDARDELVFQLAAERAIPIAFNLAGGYNGLKTIDLHARTVMAARLGSAQARRSAALYSATLAVLKAREKALADAPAVDDVVNDGSAPKG